MRLLLLLFLFPLLSWGQTINSTSGSNSTATTTSQQGNNQTIIQASGPEISTVRSAPTVVPPTVGMTANCMIGASVGASGLGFGIAAGGGIEDKGCTLRESARLLYSVGEGAAAVRLLCADPAMNLALGEKCRKPVPQTCYFDASYAASVGSLMCQR